MAVLRRYYRTGLDSTHTKADLSGSSRHPIPATMLSLGRAELVLVALYIALVAGGIYMVNHEVKEPYMVSCLTDVRLDLSVSSQVRRACS